MNVDARDINALAIVVGEFVVQFAAVAAADFLRPGFREQLLEAAPRFVRQQLRSHRPDIALEIVDLGSAIAHLAVTIAATQRSR